MLNLQASEQRDCTEQAAIPEHDQHQLDGLSESEVILPAERGDASAFERLYHLHSARVYALFLRMVGNLAEAEDLTQETFMLAMRKLHTFRGDSAFSTWLHRIAINLFLMRRRKKTPREMSLEEINDLSNARHSPLEELSRLDLRLTGSLDRLQIERAMAKLSPFQKLVVILHDVQGYKHVEIARMMDWSINNSKSQLHRARARLRKLLRQSLRFDSITPPRAAAASGRAWHPSARTSPKTSNDQTPAIFPIH